MSYFLSSKKFGLHQELVVRGEEARHMLLSRRMRVGDVVKIQSINEKRYETEIIEIGKHELTVKVLREVFAPKELLKHTHLFQSILAEKALDFVFQKGTELGVTAITLYNSQNTAMKLSKELFERKYERWQKILWEAAKQCDRGRIPELKFESGISDIMKSDAQYDQVTILDVTGVPISNLKPNTATFALHVGPEGGFTPEEIAQLQTIRNSTLVSISPFVLRAETAAIAGVSILSNL